MPHGGKFGSRARSATNSRSRRSPHTTFVVMPESLTSKSRSALTIILVLALGAAKFATAAESTVDAAAVAERLSVDEGSRRLSVAKDCTAIEVKKKCKKTAGCAYKKKTCISCSELSKKKCKKTDGCDYKKKQCSAASSCSGLSKRECKTTDGCKYKKKKDKCLAK